MNGISKLDDGTGIVNPNSYMSDAQVRQPVYLNSINNWDKYKSFLPEDLKKLDQLLK